MSHASIDTLVMAGIVGVLTGVARGPIVAAIAVGSFLIGAWVGVRS